MEHNQTTAFADPNHNATTSFCVDLSGSGSDVVKTIQVSAAIAALFSSAYAMKI
jgi:hypothetical protein